MDVKVCSKCQKETPATTDFFHKSKTGKYGLSATCKECYKVYCQENKNQISEKNRRRREQKPEEIIEYKKQWAEQNKDHIKKKSRIYYATNKEVIAQKQSSYNRINSDTKKEKVKVWRSLNPDKANAVSVKRRLLEQSVSRTLTRTQWKQCMSHFNNSCAYCGIESELEKDHFVPLENQGPTTKSNILPACRSCNVKKKSLDFFVWYPAQQFYSKGREEQILKYLEL